MAEVELQVTTGDNLALVSAAQAVLRAYDDWSGHEPSTSVLERHIDVDLRGALSAPAVQAAAEPVSDEHPMLQMGEDLRGPKTRRAAPQPHAVCTDGRDPTSKGPNNETYNFTRMVTYEINGSVPSKDKV